MAAGRAIWDARGLPGGRAGWREVEVREIDPDDLLLAERHENEVRKDFTPSERVTIARAIADRIGDRQGQRTDRIEGEPALGHEPYQVPLHDGDGVGEEGLYRVRAGDYRVLYRVEHAHRIVFVAAVGHRRDIHRGL